MAIQDERSALRLSRRVGTHNIDGVVIGHSDWREPFMIADRVFVDHPAIHAISTFGQRTVDKLLGCMLLPTQ